MRNKDVTNIYVRILIFFVCWLVSCGFFYGIVFLIYPDAFTKSAKHFEMLLSTDHSFLILTQLAILLGTICSVLFAYRYIEEKKDSILPRIMVKGLLSGVILGCIVISLSVAILWSTGLIKLHFQGITIELFFYFIAFLIIAFSEELLSRGYILKILYQEKNKYKAIFLSSIIFSLFHSLNSSITLIGFLNLFLSGILFSYLYIVKGMELSAPIGLHLSWNFLQGPVFGFAVSGFNTKSIFYIEHFNLFFSGGEFGLEGSMVLTFIIITSIIYYFIVDRRNSRLAYLDL